MKITVIREDMVSTSYWSGGISKQYYIYPSDSSYAARDFKFRLSMAVSSAEEEAPYSHLENITRHLIMLEGIAHVFHKGHYDLVMHPYEEIDVFDGGWESSGSGKATDFNLMLGKGVSGKMSVIAQDDAVKVGEFCTDCEQPFGVTAFLCGYGSAELVFIDGERFVLNQGDLLLVEEIKEEVGIGIFLKAAKLVRMDICL
ncbi:MAG: HutD family protein [Acidaminococcaceae bacterium]